MEEIELGESTQKAIDIVVSLVLSPNVNETHADSVRMVIENLAKLSICDYKCGLAMSKLAKSELDRIKGGA